MRWLIQNQSIKFSLKMQITHVYVYVYDNIIFDEDPSHKRNTKMRRIFHNLKFFVPSLTHSLLNPLNVQVVVVVVVVVVATNPS